MRSSLMLSFHRGSCTRNLHQGWAGDPEEGNDPVQGPQQGHRQRNQALQEEVQVGRGRPQDHMDAQQVYHEGDIPVCWGKRYVLDWEEAVIMRTRTSTCHRGVIGHRQTYDFTQHSPFVHPVILIPEATLMLRVSKLLTAFFDLAHGKNCLCHNWSVKPLWDRVMDSFH